MVPLQAYELKMWYQPRQKNGELVKLTWPLAFCRRANPVIWPLEDDNPSQRHLFLDRFITWCAFLVFLMHTEVDFHYLLINLNHLENFSVALATNLLQVESDIRIFHLAMRKNQLKKLKQYFYSKIYVSQEEDADSFKRITRQNILPRIIAIFYTTTLINFFEDFTRNNLNGRRVMLYAQVYPFNNTWLPFYIPLICLNFWLGLLVDTMLFGELNLLGEFMMHLNARYLELGKDLRFAAVQLLESDDATHIAQRYREELTKILRRNNILNSFARVMENEFNFRIFISFSFSAVLLCVLLFKCYSVSSGNSVLSNLIYLILSFAGSSKQPCLHVLVHSQVSRAMHIRLSRVYST